MSLEDKVLPIPPQVEKGGDGPDVAELLRVWWAVDRPQMILRPVLQDPKLVGSVLAEAAWHFSRAYAEREGKGQEDVLDAIRKEWEGAHERSAGIRERARDTPMAEVPGNDQ